MSNSLSRSRTAAFLRQAAAATTALSPCGTTTLPHSRDSTDYRNARRGRSNARQSICTRSATAAPTRATTSPRPAGTATAHATGDGRPRHHLTRTVSTCAAGSHAAAGTSRRSSGVDSSSCASESTETNLVSRRRLVVVFRSLGSAISTCRIRRETLWETSSTLVTSLSPQGTRRQGPWGTPCPPPARAPRGHSGCVRARVRGGRRVLHVAPVASAAGRGEKLET
jgi:hypothetical protein